MTALRFIFAFTAFLAVYGLADWAGSHMPEWMGYAILLGSVAGLIVLMVKLLVKAGR